VTEPGARARRRDQKQAIADPEAAVGRVLGACHGFHVCSDLPVALTRSADLARPMPILSVQQASGSMPEPTEPALREWVPGPGTPFSARLHRLPDGYGMWIDDLGAYHVSPAASRITVPAGVPVANWEPRLWGMPAALCYIARGDVSLHAAAVDVDGSALLFIAPGRFGKTTLAAAFLRAGHRVLAEDMCRCAAHPVPSVYPGPAMLRMRRDSHERLGDLPGTRVALEDDERVHLVMADSLRGGGEPVPIGAVVALQVGSGPTTLEPISAAEAIPLLWATSFNFADRQDRIRCFQGVSAVAGTVPVWRLSRRLEYGGLPSLVEQIVATCVRDGRR
jgi:hypothetical protein